MKGSGIKVRKVRRIWIAVETYEGLVQDVHLFFKEKEALDWYQDYTGFSYGKNNNEDYEETKIFVIDLNFNPSYRENSEDIINETKGSKN